MIKNRRVIAIFNKEWRHILRDPFTLLIALALPLLMLLMFGTAIEFNIKELKTTFVDQDRSQSSRIFLDTLASSDYFRLRSIESPTDGFRNIEQEKSKAIIIIPKKFEANVLGKGEADVQIMIDGSDNSSVSALMGYFGAIKHKIERTLSKEEGAQGGGLKLKTRFLYNPELNSRWFIVPALGVVIMSILSLLLTSLTISREWENGSMELLLSTPVKASEIIFGKILPYALLCVVSVIIVYFAARIIYKVPFVGSHFVYGFASILFLLTYLGLGLLISTVIRNQQAAVQIALSVGLLPSVLFSGFIFPLEHMPKFFQYLASILPAKWYMDISRNQFLKGSSFSDLWVNFAVLAVSTYIIIHLCIVKFKGNLEK